MLFAITFVIYRWNLPSFEKWSSLQEWWMQLEWCQEIGFEGCLLQFGIQLATDWAFMDFLTSCLNKIQVSFEIHSYVSKEVSVPPLKQWKCRTLSVDQGNSIDARASLVLLLQCWHHCLSKLKLGLTFEFCTKQASHKLSPIVENLMQGEHCKPQYLQIRIGCISLQFRADAIAFSKILCYYVNLSEMMFGIQIWTQWTTLTGRHESWHADFLLLGGRSRRMR